MNHPKPSEAVEAVALATVNDLRETIRRKSKLKGRQADDASITEVRQLIGEAPHRRDLLIEHLHKLNDAYRALHDRHYL
jgi:formate dehydrogenase